MTPFSAPGRKTLQWYKYALLCMAPFSMMLIACDIQSISAASADKRVQEAGESPRWGTSKTPFAVDSPWNSRPVEPVLAKTIIPPSKYAPAIMTNGWSTGVFVSKDADPPVTVRGHAGSQGLWNPDAHAFQDVTLPHWPSDVKPASKSDGHADIIDPAQGIIHSFYQLRHEGGGWVASQYAWSSLNGRGWGDPAHYFQGSRATGVPAMAGLILKHEVNDGAPMYRHALAMSLTTNALSPDPAYIFPATSADKEARRINFGKIPEGALMMLPASFDTSRLSDARVRKIAETLKTYGAYVVDRNDGTPFVIYAEQGSELDLHNKFWNIKAIADLEQIRLSLRQAVSAKKWLDGQGRSYTPVKDLNLMSMRGPWNLAQGNAAGVFDSRSQSVLFPETPARTVQVKHLPPSITNVAWATPVSGSSYLLTAAAAGGAKLRLKIIEAATEKPLIDSGELGNGETFRFAWPAQKVNAALYAISGTAQASRISADLRRDGEHAMNASVPAAQAGTR
jgi:hypothetical protein